MINKLQNLIDNITVKTQNHNLYDLKDSKKWQGNLTKPQGLLAQVPSLVT